MLWKQRQTCLNNPANNVLFSSDLWKQALESYARDTHLSVKLFDADERVVFGPIHPTPLFQLFEERAYDPGMFAECARRCLEQTESRPTVMVSEFYGLAVVGTSLVLEGKVVGAAVGGYAFVDFAQLSEAQRLARDAGIGFERLWQVAREQKPVPKDRLILNGELLQVLGDALLRENHRTRQYEEVALKLEEAARAKDNAHQELQQTASALRESGERFRFMAESMPQKIITAKPNGDVDYFNQQWMEYTGLTFEQIKDWGWTHFIHPDDVAENLLVWQHSIDTGQPFQFEQRFRGADGNYRWHLSRAVPMRDANGNITMWIGSNTDIQTVREQEDRLRKTEKMAAAGQLAASMAHEVNNPLSSVANALYLLGTYPNLDESARVLVTTAATELARVSRIVKQSLSYYRVGTIPRDVDLGGIVNESLQIFSERFRRVGIELKSRIHSGPLLIGFPDELRQVIDNLLLNALEAMPGGGRLSISVHKAFDRTHDHNHRKGVRLTIADTGCGIPRDHRWRIFEPFFTTKPEKGNGLGLWILQGIISKHEGVMSLRSSDTKDKSGTVISVFLPFARAHLTSKPSKAESAA
jgi:PAS domain S-box-containing protein